MIHDPTTRFARSENPRRLLALALSLVLVVSLVAFGGGFAVAGVDVGFVGTLGGSGRTETYPSGVEVAPDGSIIAADTGGDRVVKYSAGGTQVWSYGSFGANPVGGLDNPRDVGVDSLGNVYIADTGNFRIIKVNSSGVYQDVWTGAPGDPIGSPMGVTVTNDVVYVADAGQKKVRIFDTDGNQTATFGGSGLCVFSAIRDVDVASTGDFYIANYLEHNMLRMSSTGACLGQWGSQGTGQSQFKAPYGVRVATDPTFGESVYVADSNNDRVQVFDLTGAYLGEVGTTGTNTQPGTHTELRRVAVAADGDIWTADLWGWRLQRFDRTGSGWVFAQQINGGPPSLTDSEVFNEVRQLGFAADGSFWAADTVHHRFVHMTSSGTVLGACGKRGWDPGEFNWPESATVDHTTGQLWVTDTKQSRLQVMNSDCSNPQFVGSSGTDLNQFNWPTSVTIRQTDRIAFVADRRNDRIVTYDVATQTPIASYGAKDTGLLDDPRQIALDPTTGNLYIADTKNNRIVELSDTNGSTLTLERNITAGLNNPEGIAIDTNGAIYIADTGNSRIVILNPNGTPDTTITGLYSPSAVSIGPDTRLYISDTHNDRIQTYTTTPTVPVNTVLPVVSGMAEVGEVLSTTDGSWTGTTPITFTYQWQRCDPGCSDITGAESSTYMVTSSDIGASLRAVVTADNGVGPPVDANSAKTSVIPQPPAAPVNTEPPVISETAQVGVELSTTDGTWTGTAPITFTYQWQRCDPGCSDITGAESSTYMVTSSDIGASLTVIVTGTNVAGSSSVTATQTDVVPEPPAAPVNTEPPVISETAQVGVELSTTDGSWTGTLPINFTYQWQRCDP
ncbi:MAG: hypothetical protein DWP92_09575, partial [Armatimonadetes bacterium]